jgi:hypothetical protein
MKSPFPLLVLSAALLSACSTAGPHQSFTYRKTWSANDPSKVLTYRYTPVVVVAKSSDTATPTQDYFKDAYKTAVEAGKGREVRNRILFELMGMVDDYYYRYTINLRDDVIGKNLAVSLAGIGTSFAATLAGGEQMKTVLAAVSTGVQTFSTAIDKEVFLDHTVQAIRFQMDANRSTIAAEMLPKMTAQPDDYPLEAGLRDIVRYYDAGTVTSALSTLSANAAKDKEKSADLAKTAADEAAGVVDMNKRINAATPTW